MLRIKLILMFVGAPLALASAPLGQGWLFFLGITFLIVALALPTKPGENLKERLGSLTQHLPGSNWFKIKR